MSLSSLLRFAALWLALESGAAGAASDQAPPPPSTHARPAQFYRAGSDAAPLAPRRIVSLAPVITETLFAIGAGDRLVGVTRFCDSPAAARSLPQVGGYTDPSVERILLLRPDLVIAMPSFGQRALLDRLRDAHIPVLTVFADTLDEVRALPLAIGAVVGSTALATEITARLDAGLDALARRPRGAHAGAAPRVLVVVGTDPIVVAGPTTFTDDVLRRLGAEPVAHRDGPAWPQWSPEAVLSARPDVVVAAPGPTTRARLQKLLGASRARIVSAEREILMRPGPSLLDDAKVLAALLDAPSASSAEGASADAPARSPP